MSTQRFSQWGELKRLLSHALEGLRPQLDVETFQLVTDFIEHNEYGVGYDWLTSVIQERSIALPDDVRNDLSRAADLMRS